MLNLMVNNLNKELSANGLNLTIAIKNDFVAYGVIHNTNMFFSISIRENLVRISEEYYNYGHQAGEITYKEVLSLTHQGQMGDVAKKIKTFFYVVAMKDNP
jgi:hypothetical protein